MKKAGWFKLEKIPRGFSRGEYQTERRTLKLSLTGEAKDVISQVKWYAPGVTENTSIKFSDKAAAKEALNWMKTITEATLNGSVCSPVQTNLVEVVSKLDGMIQSL